jgi:hypothetical protein
LLSLQEAREGRTKVRIRISDINFFMMHSIDKKNLGMQPDGDIRSDPALPKPLYHKFRQDATAFIPGKTSVGMIQRSTRGDGIPRRRRRVNNERIK